MIEIGATSTGIEVRCDPGLWDVLAQVPAWLSSVGRPGVDPAADRLSPHTYLEDAEADAEFVRLMEPELESGRAEDRTRYRVALERARDGRTRLDEEDILAVLRVLDEARLVMAARLGIDSDHWRPAMGGETSHDVRIYEVIGWVQAELIDAAEEVLLGDS